MSMNDNRRIVGEGTPESDWLAWPGLLDMPAAEASALVPAGSRIVMVAPHPDDEIVGCAGLLMQLAALGHEILILGVTDGTGSHPGSGYWTPERLAKARPQESLRALEYLGLAKVPILRLGLIDTRVTQERAALIAHLDDHLQPDDILVTTWRGDGHPDHEATGQACAEVASTKGCSLIELPIWTWHWASPGDPRVPWERARRIELSLDQYERKCTALEAHVSQLTADDTTEQGPVLAPFALARLLRPFEVLFL
ncbi:PIG-L deacetylase family protein [Halomonas sp. M20]|uniref:PIG-L deacetylase family protein n=1 Tax=Halomonas sp. M20 TaxID=2763264 RepID=UPI001D0A11DA|nr:PIG-L family deacetylase [Halomonas sp. M20]